MKEKLSALVDGELPHAECDQLLAALAVDPALKKDWQHWHMVGDALNEHPLLSPDFMERFSVRLAAEPIVIAPAARRRKRDILKRAVAPFSVAASVAFVSLVAWQAYHGASQPSLPSGGAQFAQNATPQTTADTSRLRAYIAAHRADLGNPFTNQDVMAVSYQAQATR
ncbi:sigma-E factor negative regulatory protein [Andreprevotia chitinilytica]|uniref:sigma-E factor negative regulatory protein n=1 Tax=Andreprevotia chitinilytica TaxID=396808 RepID=UPI00147020D7|nr:sigma-E factor negative regulatory protein [Andreprevotia chitinilytica]